MAKASKTELLRSMTGYGRGSCENRYATASVELRSVNGKGLIIKLRMPGDRLELESKVEAVLRRSLDRGSINGSVRVKVLDAGSVELDLDALKRYLSAWREAEKKLGLKEAAPSMSELLALPGAYQGSEESPAVTKAVARIVQDATQQAVEALCAAREQEGARLGREMKRLHKRLVNLLKKVEKRIPTAQKELATRLKERVNQALSKAERPEPIDLARELVLLAERADVQEETARLHIHLERLAEKQDLGGPIGRELEFLVQECHREVTTLGNKSSDSGLSELVVAQKLVLQQMKEQLANVE
ncbi:MAG: YicC family protein [Planctomycetes bacterium]|nr:YicC family protein [Planctomycetota bacterium]MCP4859795.1 YicC family protein [Planctomycetota bacterium]